MLQTHWLQIKTRPGYQIWSWENVALLLQIEPEFYLFYWVNLKKSVEISYYEFFDDITDWLGVKSTKNNSISAIFFGNT